MPSWNWDEVDSEGGVAHESVANTDHDDATILKQGFDYSGLPLGVSWAAFWPLHEDSGTTTNDISGNGHTGTISGASVGAGGIFDSTAYNFDGVDDEVNGDGTFSIDNTTGGLSVVAVLYPHWDTTGNGDHFAVRCHADGSNNFALAYRDQWQFSWSSSNITWADDTNRDGVYTTVVMTADDQSTVTGNIYINGDLKVSDTFGSGQDVVGSVNWSLGYDLNTNARYFDGRIMEAGVIDTQLTADQVTEYDDAVRSPGNWFSTTKTI